MHTHTHMYIRVNVQFELISTNFELLDISKSLIKNNIHIILYSYLLLKYIHICTQASQQNIKVMFQYFTVEKIAR